MDKLNFRYYPEGNLSKRAIDQAIDYTMVAEKVTVSGTQQDFSQQFEKVMGKEFREAVERFKRGQKVIFTNKPHVLIKKPSNY